MGGLRGRRAARGARAEALCGRREGRPCMGLGHLPHSPAAPCRLDPAFHTRLSL